MDYNMLIANKATPGSVASWLNNSTIQNDVPEIILEAESWIYRRLRHWQMLTPPTYGTMIIGQDYITLPTDLLEPFMLFTTQQYFQVMPQKTTQEVIANWSWTSNGANTYTRTQQQPLMYYQDNTALRFDSPPDQAYAYALIYFQQPAPLATSITNFLTNTYPRLVRAAVMASSTEWTKESGTGQIDRTYWDQVAQDEVEKAQQESDRAKRATEAGMVLIGGGISSNFPSYVTGY